MYIVSTAALDKNGSVFHSNIAGRYAGQRTHTGILKGGTALQGHIVAITQGLERLFAQYGGEYQHVDVLILGDEQTAEVFRRKTVQSIFPSDDALWEAYFAAAAKFRHIRFVTSHSDSQHVTTIWRWMSTPPEHGEIPAGF